MSHFKLVSTSNQTRMLLAVLLAVAAHLSIMPLSFTRKSLYMPNVSLPRSVSVFLGQSNLNHIPEQHAEKIQDTVMVPVELPIENFEQELPPTAPVKQTNDTLLQNPILPDKLPARRTDTRITPLPAEKTLADQELRQNETATVKPDQGDAADNQLPLSQPAEGVKHPGTIRMAYPRYQFNDPPQYPGLARKRGQEGTVLLQVLVNKKGRVDDLEIEKSSGFGLLDRAAVSAVRNWKFEPGREGNEKIPMWVRVPVTFQLNR